MVAQAVRLQAHLQEGMEGGTMTHEDPIDAVLSQVDLAMLAARMARPDGSALAIKSALRLAQDDLRRIRADTARRPRMSRSTAATVPLDTLQRLAEVSQRPATVDSVLLDSLDEATLDLAKGFYTARPQDLLGLARLHVNRLESLTQLSMAIDHRHRLGSMISDAAALAGWSALDSDRKGDARAYFGLARDAAREAGDAVLHALAVASIGVYHAPAYGGMADGASTWHLRQAGGRLPQAAPDYARAWIAAHLAKEEAATGHTYAFHAALELVDHALERADPREPVGSFWSDEAWFGYLGIHGWREGFRARGLAYLGHGDAGALIVRLLANAMDPRAVARLHLSLAEWHLGRDEPEQAATAATGALGATPAWDAQARNLRRRLKPWETLPAVKELDEVIILTAA